MNIETARKFAVTLLEICEQAEAEGRTELVITDLQTFAELDDAAAADLQAAIDAANGIKP